MRIRDISYKVDWKEWVSADRKKLDSLSRKLQPEEDELDLFKYALTCIYYNFLDLNRFLQVLFDLNRNYTFKIHD